MRVALQGAEAAMRIALGLIAIVVLSWNAPVTVPADLSGRLTPGATVQEKPRIRAFIIKGRGYTFSPARIEVNRGDVVKLTLIAEDVPYGFEIAEYRVCKRVTPERPVTLEFLADKAGTFVYFCNLTTDEKCRAMRGELIVR
jgi:cytochrome c oxidase subunit 2